jgi:hypothetical protein
VPAGDLGGSFGAQAFVQTNAANSLPENSGAVRGNINSIILLEPVDGYTTRVRYVCEIEPKGWLPTMVTEKKSEKKGLPGVDDLADARIWERDACTHSTVHLFILTHIPRLVHRRWKRRPMTYPVFWA